MDDWDAVGAAITERLAAMRMTQQQLAGTSGVSPATIRDLQHGRRRTTRGRTLSALSDALGWPTGYLTAVLRGESPPDESPPRDRDPILAELEAIHAELKELRNRVADQDATAARLHEITTRLDALERTAEPPSKR